MVLFRIMNVRKIKLLFSFFPMVSWGGEYQDWRPSCDWSQDHESRFQGFIYNRTHGSTNIKIQAVPHLASSPHYRAKNRHYTSTNSWLQARERNYRINKRERARKRFQLQEDIRSSALDFITRFIDPYDFQSQYPYLHSQLQTRQSAYNSPYRSTVFHTTSPRTNRAVIERRESRQESTENRLYSEELRQEAAIEAILQESQLRRNDPSFRPTIIPVHETPQQSNPQLWENTYFWPSSTWSQEQEKAFVQHALKQEERPNKEKKTDVFLEKLKSVGIEKPYLRGSILHGGLNLSGDLKELNDNSKTEIIDLLTTLDWLDELRLDDNDIIYLPKSIGRLKSLKYMDLYKNKLTKLPEEFWTLTSLEDLELSNNLLHTLYTGNQTEGLRNLTSLRSLHLNNLGLTSLPADIGLLNKLKKLYLHHNDLKSLPPELWTLHGLKTLEIRDNDLKEIPADIEQLTNLKILDLAYNQLNYLPNTVANLINLVTLNLEMNEEFAPNGRSNAPALNLWGRDELVAHFQNKLLISPISYTKIISRLVKKMFYHHFDQQPYRLHRDNIRLIKMPDLPVDHVFNGHELLSSFRDLLITLNLMDDKSPDYLSFSVLALDLEQKIYDTYGDVEVNSYPNHSRIQKYLIPQFTGYFKTLYEISINPDESYGWQMEESNRPYLKRALTFILETLNKITDKTQKAILFTQFTYGMLHCPSGQKEGIDTVILSLLEGNLRGVDLKSKIENLIAIRKNIDFQKAILSKGGASDQNVHLITTYGERLGEELGLSSTLGNYQETLGIMGIDPFRGCEASVLKSYYDWFTPQCLISLIQDKTQSIDDLHIKHEIGVLQKKRDQSHAKVLLSHFESNLKSKKERAQNNNLEQEERITLNQQITILEQKVAQLRINLPSQEDNSDLSQEIRRLTHEFVKNKLFRPFTPGDYLLYLTQHNLVDLTKANWWHPYFTQNPLEDELSAFTARGIEKILIHMEIIIDER